MTSTNDILAIVLGGGRGTRLYPLTAVRSKPAVPIAGKYRLIDIPISNCINSGIFRIAVLTQFNSVSLHRHITNTYLFDSFHTGWVQIWAAEQTISSATWYQGTADAVRKQLFEIRSTRAPYVLILAGDHLYTMDFAPMFDFHIQNQAEITVAVQPVANSDTGRFGILKRDPDCRLTDFAEKPKDPALLEKMVSRADPQRPYLGSMGIYLFNTDTLVNMLETNLGFDDFGGDVIPHAIEHAAVFGFDFDGYWEDIGTIRSFYDTNLLLTMPDSPFNLYDSNRPIYSHGRYLPGSIVQNSQLENVLLAEGCRIEQAEIRHSVIGLRSIIHSGVKITDTVMMGADYYLKKPGSATNFPESGLIPLGVGKNSQISGAILDKNVQIGESVNIRPYPRGTDLDLPLCVVRDGIVVVAKSTVIPDDTVIGP
ncbi:MAG TPA: glucose-1-phosphate adenylyltransferase [Bellilinea sp.]|nr:glucose-1-phosphate adenylyltransferase [Bellilinea sp.]